MQVAHRTVPRLVPALANAQMSAAQRLALNRKPREGVAIGSEKLAARLKQGVKQASKRGGKGVSERHMAVAGQVRGQARAEFGVCQ